jgi:hypothetical protein
VIPPGKRGCPFHSHRGEEEMFFIVKGAGLLRYGAETRAIRAGDFICCPTGGPDTAHQIVNDSDADLAYISVSTMMPAEVCEYPDSGKVGAFGGAGEARLRHMTDGRRGGRLLEGRGMTLLSAGALAKIERETKKYPPEQRQSAVMADARDRPGTSTAGLSNEVMEEVAQGPRHAAGGGVRRSRPSTHVQPQAGRPPQGDGVHQPAVARSPAARTRPNT